MYITSTAWIKNDSKDNAVATATKAASPGNTQCLDGVIAGFTTNPAVPKLLTIKDGTTTIAEFYFLNSAYIPLHGVICGEGNAVSAEIEASGVAGNLGKVALIGHPR
jgi:hypothetical protein